MDETKQNLNLPASKLPWSEQSQEMPLDFRSSFHWRVFRIMSEFVDGWQFITDYKDTISILGSARFAEENRWYQEARKLGALLAKAKLIYPNPRSLDLRAVSPNGEWAFLQTPEADFIENLSQGGAFVRTHSPSPVGTRLALEMRLPGGIELAAPATVVFLHAYGMGVKFDLDAGGQAKLASAIARISARPRRALVVDDDAMICRMLADALREQIAAALAAGNSVVLKPSSSTPITALLLGDILLKAGLPKEALHIVSCSPTAAEPILTHPLVKMITFTGSPVVGWGIKSRAGQARVTLELGGNAATIVAPSADLDLAVRAIAFGATGTSGQRCTSMRRLIVHEDIYGPLLARLKAAYGRLGIGDPRDSKTLELLMASPVRLRGSTRCASCASQLPGSRHPTPRRCNRCRRIL